MYPEVLLRPGGRTRGWQSGLRERARPCGAPTGSFSRPPLRGGLVAPAGTEGPEAGGGHGKKSQNWKLMPIAHASQTTEGPGGGRRAWPCGAAVRREPGLTTGLSP